MANLPKSQIAIIAQDNGRLKLAEQVDLPDLEPDMVLVKTAAVALNPVDIKMSGPLASPGAVAGHDYAGTVVALGSEAWTAAGVKVGDRVCGAVMGMHVLTPKVGAYAQYVGGTDVGVLKIPEHMSFTQAATLGTGIGTAGLALFRSLQIPGWPTRPAEKPQLVLVYGGSTATGTLVIQLLKLSGMQVITTSSPHNHTLLRSLGADHVLDYNQPPDALRAAIKSLSHNALAYVIDCVSDPETMAFCYSCVGRLGGRLTSLEPLPRHILTRPRTVHVDWVLGPALAGKAIGWPAPMGRDPNPSMREFAKIWFATVQELLDSGKLKPHPQRLIDGGLPEVFKGLEMIRKKQVSGQKLVYVVSG